MIRLSSAVFGCFIAVVASTTGCKVSAETKDRVHSDDNAVEDTVEWAGEPIVIDIKSAGIVVNGGVNVTADPATKKINLKSRIVAYAFPEHKPDAELSIADVKSTLKITHDNGTINITCDHGQSHGDSDSGSSGCELTNINVPVGSATQPLTIKVLVGNGPETLVLNQATIKDVTSTNKAGSINANLPATQGATVLLVSEQGDDVTANLPTGFAADHIELVADADKRHLNNIADVTLDNVGVATRGTAGTGLASIKLSSVSFAGESGEVTLQSVQ